MQARITPMDSHGNALLTCWSENRKLDEYAKPNDVPPNDYDERYAAEGRDDDPAPMGSTACQIERNALDVPGELERARDDEREVE